jgi:hypothetical protein
MAANAYFLPAYLDPAIKKSSEFCEITFLWHHHIKVSLDVE